MRTYGALVELSAIREMYGPSINFPHTPTASRMAPVIWRPTVGEMDVERESTGNRMKAGSRPSSVHFG